MIRTSDETVVLKEHGLSRAENATGQIGALVSEERLIVEDAFLQGLKPNSSLVKSLARLKSCPFKAEVFRDSARIFGVFFLRVVALLLAAIASLSAQSAASAQPAAATGYRVAGIVVNANTGEPLHRVTVALLSTDNSQTVQSVETDNEGHFEFTGLAAAKYPLTASKRGFLTAFYDQHDEGYNSAIVTGDGQDTSGLVFRLVPGAAIHGVVNGDGGDPVEGASVMLFVRPRNHNPGAKITQASDATTDDTGAYEFDGLAPGEYLLAVSAQPWFALNRPALGLRQHSETVANAALDVAYPVTFFDSTTDEASATRIVLTGGSREEANINLRAVPALHLTMQTPGKQDASIAWPSLEQTILGSQIPANPNTSTDSKASEVFEFSGIPPGHYQVKFGDPARIAQVDATASQQIDPSLGLPTVTVSGSLGPAYGSVLPENLTVILNPLDGAQNQLSLQTTCIKSSFTFAAVPPGSWRLMAYSPGKTLSVSSISAGAKAQAGNTLTVKDKPVQIEATASLGETRIEGFARKSGKGMAGAMIVLVPRNPGANSDQFRRDQSDSDGSFSLRDLPPGEYTVVAIEDGWDLDWARPEVIGRYLPMGIAVTVTAASGKLIRLSEAVPVQAR